MEFETWFIWAVLIVLGSMLGIAVGDVVRNRRERLAIEHEIRRREEAIASQGHPLYLCPLSPSHPEHRHLDATPWGREWCHKRAHTPEAIEEHVMHHHVKFYEWWQLQPYRRHLAAMSPWEDPHPTDSPTGQGQGWEDPQPPANPVPPAS